MISSIYRYAGSGDWREAVLGGLPARKISFIRTEPKGHIHTLESQSEEGQKDTNDTIIRTEQNRTAPEGVSVSGGTARGPEATDQHS